MNPQPRTSHVLHSAIRAGFSLIELLVVISVIVILFTVALPSLRSLTGSGQASAAVNTFSAAVAAARSYAGLSPPFDYGEYSGCAIIFDTAGQLRLTLNAERFPSDHLTLKNQFLVDEDGRPLEQPQSSGSNDRESVNGYIDAGREYLNMPRGTMAVGILRGGTGSGTPKLIHPPFAVRFNQSGNLIASNNLDAYPSSAPNPAMLAGRIVLYDRNNDGAFITRGSAGSAFNNPYGGGTYDVNEWMPDSPDFVNNIEHRTYMPFEKLQTVAGVVFFSTDDMRDADLELSQGGFEDSFGSGTVGAWIMEHGVTVFINRYTGSLNKVQ